MAKIRTPSPVDEEIVRITELLDNSMEASGLGSREFLDKTRQYMLDRYLVLAPDQPVRLPSGRSYLASMVKLSFDHALSWEQRFGPLAWRPTPKHPYPLEDIVTQLKRGPWDKREYRWPSGAAANAKGVEQFLVSGFTHAMPVSIPRAQFLMEAGKRSSHTEFNAQTRLTQFCQIDDDLFKASTKIRHFAQAQGLITLGITEKLDWMKWYAAGALDPDTPVAIYLPGRTRIMPWTQAWAENFHDAPEMFKCLDPAQYDVDGLRQEYLRKALPRISSWEEAKELLNTTPGGWELTSSKEPHRLLWQEVLIDKPAWLKEVSLEPKARLRQTASGGPGIWECVFEGWTRFSGEQDLTTRSTGGPLPTREAVECLAVKVPLPLLDSGGQLFVPHSQTNPILTDAFELTFAASPQTWVGQPTEDQANLASSLLSNLLVGQNRGNASDRAVAAQQSVLLYRAWRHAPQSLNPSTVSVLWCLREYLSQADLKMDTVDISELTCDTFLPQPKAGTMEWASIVHEQIYRPHPTAALMTSILDRARLTALSADRPASQSPRGPRHL